MNLPDEVKFCLDTISNAGIDAYLVGGCVRDKLLGKSPDDYDITVNAPPEKIRELFPHTFDTGIKHGTITVLVNKMPMEVTQMRIDGEYSDHRRPAEIVPAMNINDDLKRRDFTINAMAMSKDGLLIDKFGGKSDLEKKIIRTVGDPSQRFNEDALRIMRAFRFACKLDFDIDKSTLDCALKLSPLLREISAERIFAELTKVIMSDYPDKFEPLIKCGALEFAGIHYNMPINIISTLPHRREIRFAALIYLCKADPLKVCKALKTDNALKKTVDVLCHYLKDGFENDELSLKKLLAQHGYNTVSDLLILTDALTKTDIKPTQKLLESLKDDPVLISQLDINGDDILQLGVSPSHISHILCFLQNEVHKNKYVNQHDILVDLAREYCKNVLNSGNFSENK